MNNLQSLSPEEAYRLYGRLERNPNSPPDQGDQNLVIETKRSESTMPISVVAANANWILLQNEEWDIQIPIVNGKLVSNFITSTRGPVRLMTNDERQAFRSAAKKHLRA